MFTISGYLEDLQKQLSTMPSSRQLAFAAWCCDSLAPQFVQRVKDTTIQDRFREILSTIWEHLLRLEIVGDELLDQCASIVLSETDDLDVSNALDALELTIRAAIDDTATNVAGVAERHLEPIFHELEDALAPAENKVLSPDIAERLHASIFEHPRYVESVNQQRRVLLYLTSASNEVDRAKIHSASERTSE